MTARTWTYRTLMTTADIKALVNERVFAKKSMTSSIEQHPYIVYKMGSANNEELAETEDLGRQFVQIFVHDFSDGDVGDYTRIDLVLKAIRAAFKLQSSAADGLISTIYLETSQDLNDETLNTVMKYIRFQLITKETA